MKKVVCNLCASEQVVLLEEITKKPTVETDYGITDDAYYRQVFKCSNCGVFFNHHTLIDLKTFYLGTYNHSINQNNFLGRFKRIINLPPEQSDNVGRVNRVVAFLQDHFENVADVKALDVGSGTCVFLHELKKYVNHTYCVDPDPTAVNHAKVEVGVSDAFQGGISDMDDSLKFDLITFNKVLEHVEDPIEQLNEAKNRLTDQGIIYVELPEGMKIYENGQIAQRAEFAVEHLTVFTDQSIRYLASEAGLQTLVSESITDPSGKYTIYSFLKKSSK